MSHPTGSCLRMEEMSEYEITMRFAQQMLGVEATDEPPPPGSPLARLLALAEQRPVTAEDVLRIRAGDA